MKKSMRNQKRKKGGKSRVKSNRDDVQRARQERENGQQFQKPVDLLQMLANANLMVTSPSQQYKNEPSSASTASNAPVSTSIILDPRL